MKSLPLSHDGTLPDSIFPPTSSTGSPTQTDLAAEHNSDEDELDYTFMSPELL